MKKITLLFFAILYLSGAGSVPAQEVDGKKLVRTLWEISAAGKWPENKKLLAPGFQGLYSFGPVNGRQELQLLEKANFDTFELSDFNITRQDNVIVATYRATVTETIRGKRIVMKNAPRMTVFIKSGEQWLWLSHAVFAPDK